MNRKEFLKQTGLASASILVLNGCNLFVSETEKNMSKTTGVALSKPLEGEDIFAFIQRKRGGFDNVFYKQILGAANEFKEGDQTLGIAANDKKSRFYARELLANTSIRKLQQQVVFKDELYELIENSIQQNDEVLDKTLGELKQLVLKASEADIKAISKSLSSDTIACLVKLMDNQELIALSQKVFNALPGSKIGSKGYMGARVQPNSPTDNIEDISWQVFNAWSYAVGDVVLGTNPVSSEPKSVAKIESALLDISKTFDLEETIPNCVLSHIDIQSEVEKEHPNTTGIWFQSLAGTVKANQTFDVTIDKMLDYATVRNGQYGFYAETGQGADLTNGHAEGFDMVMHESRKYGFLRALKQRINEVKGSSNSWVHVNDVAGFIGPEVFRTKEQLVRCCLEDTVMGKLHGLTIGLDICSTLHMDVNLDDLDWCIEKVMPANPAYLMALPTKNDPMLSYLTTAFNNHVKVREQFGYKVNDAMWEFFKDMGIIDDKGNPTEHFGDPIWVYYQYEKRKGTHKTKAEIYRQGQLAINRIEKRGVPIAQGYGNKPWELNEKLDQRVRYLYEDAKESLWTEMNARFIKRIENAVVIKTASKNREDYVYHPESGESLTEKAQKDLTYLRDSWKGNHPDVQLFISDGLNARSIMDDDHLSPFLSHLRDHLGKAGIKTSNNQIVIRNGRVRAGYASGELLFGKKSTQSHGIVHIIGERPGTGHHNFSAYLTVAQGNTWRQKGKVDHDISRVVSGISDTALSPKLAAEETARIMLELFKQSKPVELNRT
ncbi:MAG: ethanolamine ammonia-lyase [Flavobacteriaceae bacterium]|nr:ethanolamine ammonia-lyase [Flavobacteriaceae bacterium]|tara:strand:- start:237272 stop:239602 length:2331 start_codon:yes stop_codon:yes gene_type:complete